MADTPAIQKKARLIFIDLMRGIAVLWMIETHVVDAMMAKFFKTGWFYDYLNISNGMVSVGFLFCAGAGYWLAVMRKGEDYINLRPPLWLHLRRLGFVIMMGYWLHMPVLSFVKTLHLNYDNYLRIIQCDILHVIVLSSVLAIILLLIFRRTQLLPYLFIVLALGAFYIAPIMLAWEPMKHMPSFIGIFFATFPYSKFPLFQWSGYFFAGAAITAFFYKAADKRKFAWYLISGSVVTLIIVFIIRALPFQYPGFQDWWRCSPGHSFFRVASISIVFSFLFLIEDYYKNRKYTPILVLCGQESLFLYIFHLMLVYGSIVNPGLKYFIGPNLNPWTTILMTLAICGVTYITAKSWNYVKMNDPKLSQRVMQILIICFILVFMINPI